LTAELTANTDFAQTEVDDAVVNLTRFPLFFPEKREFFLERAGIFEFGLGGRRGGAAERNLQMFFSRRIGLTPDRVAVPVRGRAKYNWFTDLHEVFVEHLYVGPEFRHDVGFVRRTGIQRTDAAYIWQPRPKRWNVRNFVFRNELVYTTDIHRTILDREQISQWTTRFLSDDAARVNTTHMFDRVERAFEIAQGIVVPAGDYGFRDTWAEYEGSGKRTIAGRIRYGGGDFYGGTRKYVQLAQAVRPKP